MRRALSQAGKLALSEGTVSGSVEDTVRREGHEGKSELEKPSRELEGGWRKRRRRKRGESWRKVPERVERNIQRGRL